MKKHTRKSLRYRFGHWVNVRGWEEIFEIVFEIITAIAFFGTLFILPHLFH